MTTLIHRRVESARRGDNQTVICRMSSGWAVLGDAQFFAGYSLLLADPVVSDLNSLAMAERLQYLADMTIIGDALLEITDAYRINYETLGNHDAALHTHIFPRYLHEPDSHRDKPVYYYPTMDRSSRPLDLSRDRALIEALKAAILTRS